MYMFATRPNGWPGNPRTLTRKSNENLVPIVPLKYRRAETFSVSTIRFLMQMRPRKRKARKNWKRRIPLLPLTWQRQKNNSTNLKWRFVCIKNLNKQSCRLKKCRNFLSTKILSPVATHHTQNNVCALLHGKNALDPCIPPLHKERERKGWTQAIMITPTQNSSTPNSNRHVKNVLNRIITILVRRYPGRVVRTRSPRRRLLFLHNRRNEYNMEKRTRW